MVVEVEQAISSKSAGGGMKKSKLVLVQTPEKKKKKKKKQTTTEAESPSYRLALKSIFSCRNSHGQPSSESSRKNLGCSSAPSICKVNNNKDHQCEQKPPPAADEAKRRASRGGGGGSSSSSSSTTGGGGSFRAGMQLRRLSGCYECHMVVDPIFRDSSSMRAAAAICPCPDCGEIFVRQESLQLHQSIRHAVSELGSDDTSRNIIEIIFQSSWLKKQSPVCRIQRILKVHNTARTLARFEEYRDAVKAKAASSSSKKKKGKNSNKHPRCTADGNELLRFHCAALGCNLGIDGATHLCGACHTCAIIRDGFNNNNNASDDDGIRTMATSGRAHDAATAAMGQDGCRAMLVCRVIAGRVKRPSSNLNLNLNLNLHEEVQQEAADDDDDDEEEEEEYESIAGSAGVYSNMEELQVFNPRAILPCFVVIYKASY
ncbi:hypothetical protein QOZ80_4AG0298390 [Eleusine coracana subsp. coracana]|nr:hypothetical protein QOZ80_4AG0298390 [Eleusine coracana subsp. coracana]